MECITYLSLLVYGPSLNTLSSPSFHARQAATANLNTVFAWPAIHSRLRTEANAEAQMRLQSINTDAGYVAARWLLDNPERMATFCRRLDANYSTAAMGSERWVRMKPFVTGTIEGDLLLCVRNANKAARTIPMVMPPYAWHP